jgi:hypothetical protein
MSIDPVLGALGWTPRYDSRLQGDVTPGKAAVMWASVMSPVVGTATDGIDLKTD